MFRPRELLSSGSGGGGSVAGRSDPAGGVEEETVGKVRDSSGPASPSRWSLVAEGCSRRLSGGRRVVRWFPRSAFFPRGKVRALPNRFGPPRELDLTFPLSVRRRWVSANPPKKCGENPEGTGVPSSCLLPSRLWPPYGMAFLTMAFSVSPEN